jgi:hypothetical protein
MTMGKGGPNYWYTEGDARRACEKALGNVTFLVTVPPNHQFQFIIGKRVVAGQWISEDSEFDTGLIAHITMSIDKLTLSPNKDETYRARLEVNNLHYTVRKKTDSDWLEKNIDNVVEDQGKKTKTDSATVIKYKEIQANSLHHGLNGAWNSGNKEKNEGAKKALNYDTNFPLFPGDLDKVQGMISTVGGKALENKVFTYPTKKKPVELAVSTASVVVT